MLSSLRSIMLIVVCLMLPGMAQAVVVSSVGALQTAVNNANSGGDKIISIANGVYDLSGVALSITADGVSVRSVSGNRSAVVLDNHYVEGGTSGIFRIVSSNVTIADMTLKRPYYHAIHISPNGANTQGILIDNVHIIDPGEQAIKINGDTRNNATYSVNNSTIKNCLIELTDAGRTNLTYTGYPCYTGGIDGHWAGNWKVQDNVIRGFWCSDGLSEHGVHFWNNSSNILVERNKIIDCDRGIGFGLGSDGNTGGIIRNNMIYHGPDHGYSDVGISVESTPNAQVYNNTVYHGHNYSAIEYRFASTSNILITNNLTNRSIRLRDGASGQVVNNLTTAQVPWFNNVAAGDLHLSGFIGDVVNQGQPVSGLIDDFDKEKRPQGGGYELGADEIDAGGTTGSAFGTLSWILLLLGN